MKILSVSKKDIWQIELTGFEFATIRLALMVGSRDKKFEKTFIELSEKIDKEMLDDNIQAAKDMAICLGKIVDPDFPAWVKKIEEIKKKNDSK